MKKKLISILIILAIFIGSGALVFSQSMPSRYKLEDYLHEHYGKGSDELGWTSKELPSDSDLHIKRNLYNRCPSNLDKFERFDDLYFTGDGYKDHRGNKWISISTDNKPGGFHNSNKDDRRTFRGVSSYVAGSQCTYYKDGGELDDSSEKMGTFDYAFFVIDGYKGLQFMVGHYDWDVKPHKKNEDYEPFLTTTY